ncbi:zinc finger B-box domain-containing protein 1 isoform X1 [Clarias gariepinus]|uniref:zinc finger B-box domain-containing protein 1 isoform X1 n=1 Tax=Clarias gariepinus TaxID=13013 RepID=UPI00234DBB49|nr:zinc finger B-box domain-containing protein 1 isoform X1 [Clarias gariepinus]
MNLNNFLALPKPKSVKLNARNLRELRMETAQLSQDNKEMEIRLQQLKEVMSYEKEEREKNGAFHWKSAQTQDGTKDKEKKFKKSAPSKIKIKVLKNEPLPERVERVPEPPPTKGGQSRKSRLKGKACGQCEARTAGLVCAECAEDYCVSCFAKFHQKGALRFHHIIPMQAELHTSISTLDVVNCFQKKTEKEEEEEIWLNHSDVGETHPECRATPEFFQAVNDNQIHNKQVLFVNNVNEENEDSLLRGTFDEEESSKSFQQALNEWRTGNIHANREHQESNQNSQSASPATMDAMGTQTGGRTHVHIEFRDQGLSYMERLLLKKHRRTQIESYQLLSNPRSLQDLITETHTQPIEENHETNELTAEEMDLHHYCISLFAVSCSAEAEKVNNIFKSCLSITEIDETAGDPLVDISFGVKLRDDKNQREDASAMVSQSRERFSNSAKPLLQKSQNNEIILSESKESFLQSQPSDQHLSTPAFHNFQISVDTNTLIGSEMLITEQYEENTLQAAQKEVESLSISQTCFKSATATAHSQRPNEIQKPLMPKVPFLSQSKSAVDQDSSLFLSRQFHSPLSSTSAAFPASFMSKFNPQSPGDQTIVYEVPNSPSSLSTSTQSLDTFSFPQSQGPFPSTSFQCPLAGFSISSRVELSPTPSELYHIRSKSMTPWSTKSSSQSQSDNTPSQSPEPSELLKSPLSAEQSFSDDEKPYIVSLGLSSSLTDILQSSPPLHLSLSNSDMSSGSVGMMPTDEDFSDEEMRRDVLHDMKEEEERNLPSSALSLFSTADAFFHSQNPKNEEKSRLFTKPCLAVRSLAQRQNNVSTNYQGLNGFFMLGLASRSVPLSLAASHSSHPEIHTHSTNSEALMSGQY